MKTLNQIFDILENKDIKIDNYTEKNRLCGYELNTYTDGGVNQIIFLDFRDGGNPKKASDFVNKFSNYIKDFDIDEEIEMYRQDPSYKANFSIRESLEDFESWKEDLQTILKLIN